MGGRPVLLDARTGEGPRAALAPALGTGRVLVTIGAGDIHLLAEDLVAGGDGR